jgi:adenylate kinase
LAEGTTDNDFTPGDSRPFVHRIVFLGPPGAGKGTQAVLIAHDWGIPHLSTGDLLRAAAAAGTPLGKEADGFMRAGKLVPDHLVLRILSERIGQPDTVQGFLLDGFPRTLDQAKALTEFTELDHVISFEIPDSLLVERLTQRRQCPKCGAVYNLATRPPKVPDRCDRDGSVLEQRADDAPQAVSIRLKVYHQQTAPLIEFYRDQGILHAIDATGTPAEVGQRIRAALAVS